MTTKADFGHQRNELVSKEADQDKRAIIIPNNPSENEAITCRKFTSLDVK